MIKIEQIKLKSSEKEERLLDKIIRILNINPEQVCSYKVIKKSIDARKKPNIYIVYTVAVTVAEEKKIYRKIKNPNVSCIQMKPYQFVPRGTNSYQTRPVIVGSGPAGLFCAYFLSLQGYQPLLIEQGAPVEERLQDVEQFWKDGTLNPYSNVQFGEGGAGTFSDGKLNTVVKDISGRNRKVLEIFVEHGAPKDILYESKPHIGTDILAKVITNMRKSIIAHGGEVRFHCELTDIIIEQLRIKEIQVTYHTGTMMKEQIAVDRLVLALGHSSRKTFWMLYNRKIAIEAKAFAVGVRIEHSQALIDKSQYGNERTNQLPPASYKLATTLNNGRGVYSFCMCPGGYVVDASSEEGYLAVNGMSYHERNGENANSAIVVTVTPEDYPDKHPLSGIAFQRQLEKKAFQLGKGTIPIQCFEDYRQNKVTKTCSNTIPNLKGRYKFANVREIFPTSVGDSIEQGILEFDKKIKGFAGPDCLLSGVESRTSSPIRMTRDDILESNLKGIYPCGEGAGYAGGITSAAIDGIKVAEMIAEKQR
ncbi:MAG: NAD(P)-binding protein [Lachnospiraceae bacterium]